MKAVIAFLLFLTLVGCKKNDYYGGPLVKVGQRCSAHGAYGHTKFGEKLKCQHFKIGGWTWDYP